MTMIFDLYEKMVYDRAWAASRITGMDFEELGSVARESFVIAYLKYCPTRGASFSTFLHSVLTNRLMVFCERHGRYTSRYSPTDLIEELEKVDDWNTPDNVCAAREEFQVKLAALSDDGKELVVWVLTRVDLICDEPALIPKNVRTRISNHLHKEEGWSKPKIWRTFKEVRELVGNK